MDTGILFTIHKYDSVFCELFTISMDSPMQKPGFFNENSGTGFLKSIRSSRTTVQLPSAFSNVSVIVYFPVFVNVCPGFCAVDVPPSPKFHCQPVMEGIAVD